jgi:prefoldin subunit 5
MPVIDKCSCGATCSQVEKLQAEIAMLSADNERLRAYLKTIASIGQQ